MCAEVPVTAQPLMAKASGRTSSPDRGNTQSITRDSCTALTHQRRPAQPAPLPARPTVLRDGGRSLQQAGQQAGCEPQQELPVGTASWGCCRQPGWEDAQGLRLAGHTQGRGFHQPSPPASPASLPQGHSCPHKSWRGYSTEAARGLRSIRPRPLDAPTSTWRWHPLGPAVPSPEEPMMSSNHGEGLSG